MKRGSKLREIASMLLLSICLTSCDKPEESQEIEVSKNQIYDVVTTDQHEITLTDREIEKIKLNELADRYSQYFANFSVEYNYIDYYLSDGQIDEIIDYSNIETHCLQTYELDVDLFFEMLKENSENYVREHSQFRIPFVEETRLEAHAWNFESNLRYTLDTIMNGENDIYEDLHQISNLTIVFGNGSSFYNDNKNESESYLIFASEDDSIILGVYDCNQNVIVVDDEAIVLIASMYYDEENQQEKFNDLLLDTLLHEFNHVRQKACPCRVAQGLILDNMFVYDGDYISTISEASAESELYMMGKYHGNSYMQFSDYVYEGERSDELLLWTLALCNVDTNIEDYYNAIANTDYASLYNFYDLRSREEIYNFYHIVYSIDSKNLRNNLWESIYNEETIEEKTLFDYTVDIGYSYRVDIFRMVLEKLTEFTNNNGKELFTLKDNLATLNIIKDIIVKDAYMYYEDDSNPEMVRYRKYYEEYMVENIVALENKYIEFLSKYYEVSIAEIRNMENNEVMDYIEELINFANGCVTNENGRLFCRLPMLKTLLKKQYISPYDYSHFMEDNQEMMLTISR